MLSENLSQLLSLESDQRTIERLIDQDVPPEPHLMLHPAMNALSVFAIMMLFFILIVSSILNTLFLVIFARKASLRTISNRFIVNLTISNLVCTWLLLPLIMIDMFLKNTSAGLFSEAFCIALNVAADLSTAASVFSTILIALDRFFAITDPLHYHMLVTKWRSWAFIILCWITATVIGVFSGLIGDGNGKWNACKHAPQSVNTLEWWGNMSYTIASVIMCFALPLLLLWWSYAKIYAAAQQNSERARRNSLCSPTLEVVEPSKDVSRSPSTRSTSSQIVSTIRRRWSNASLFLYREEARAAKISIGVVLLFVLCWMPFYVVKIFFVTLPKGSIDISLFHLALVFALANSAISPYVYIYRSKRIKREARRLFGLPAKEKRSQFERKRPFYHHLSANLEKIPASPICIDGEFKLEITEVENKPPKMFFAKILHSETWKSSNIFPSSCISAPAQPSASCSTSSSSYPTSYTSSNINSSTQTLNNLIPISNT